MANNSGINRLIAVTQLKAGDADDEAMKGADKQRDLLAKQKVIRDAKRALEEMGRDGVLSIDEAQRVNKKMAECYGEGMQKPQVMDGWWYTNGEHTEFRLSEGPNGEDNGFKKNKDKLDSLNKSLEDFTKELEGLDRLGNFDVQQLLSQYNTAETLASSTKKKVDDTASSVISKI